MVTTFDFLKPDLLWIQRAFNRVIDDDQALLDDKGWDKLWARVDMAMGAERSARRAGATGCVWGEKCPEDTFNRCDFCAAS